MKRFVVATAGTIAALFLGSAGQPASKSSTQTSLFFTHADRTLAPAAHVAMNPGGGAGPLSLAPPAVEPPPPPPPTPQEALRDGVLIVVSLPSQKAFVFKDGEAWESTDVSTGKPGNDTPEGAFPILQKKVHHRSSLYDDAPMPYMQRLTWDGVALHAGRVPGYPASHGCIRMPKAFAKKLYEITGFSKTIVLVTDKAVTSANEAKALA